MPTLDPVVVTAAIKAGVEPVSGYPMTAGTEAIWLAIDTALANWITAWGGGGGGGSGTVTSVTSANAMLTIANTTTTPVITVVPSAITGIPETNITNLTSDLAALSAGILARVPTTRTLNATAPLRVNAGASADLSADQTWSIANNGITNALFRQGAATSLVGVGGNATANVADILATTDNQFPLRSGGLLGFTDFPTAIFNVLTGAGYYGYGTDGAPVFDGTTTVLGFVPVANRYLVTRDLFVTNMTINTGVVVAMASTDPEVNNAGATQGRRVFGTGTLTLAGTARLINNGRGGVAGVATANAGGPTCFAATGPASGGGGAIGAGAAGGNTGTHIWGAQTATAGVAALTVGNNAVGHYLGGSGGGGGTGAGGAGGSTAALSGASQLGVHYSDALASGVLVGGTTPFAQGGSGGGAGGGDGTRQGGAGGGPGGVSFVRFRFITGTGSIEAKGGNGNTGVVLGNTGGGGGGGGGTLTITTATQLSSSVLLASGVSLIYTGGLGAAGTGTGKAGGNGSDGFLFFANP